MDQSQKDALKATLMQDFNRVGAKVIKVSDFMQAFETLMKKDLNFVERGLVKSQKPSIDFKNEKFRAQIKKGTKGETGIYFDVVSGKVVESEANAYVSSTVLQTVIMDNVEAVEKLPAPVRTLADKVRKIVVDALVECEDHSAQLKAGKLKAMIV